MRWLPRATFDKKMSEKSSNVLKSHLEDVSIDFSTYDMSNTLIDSDSDRSTFSEKNMSAIVESTDLSVSLSSSHDSEPNVEVNLATKQLLMRILSFPVANTSTSIALSSNQVPLHLLEAPSFDVEDKIDMQKISGQERSSLRNVPAESDLKTTSSEIERLTNMLKDRRLQFRDLVRPYQSELPCWIEPGIIT